jgi:hypothetical protein
VDYDQAVQLADRIVTGRSIIEYKNKLFVVNDPTPFERQMGFVYYEKELARLKEEGVPLQKEVQLTYEKQGYLSQQHKKFNETYKKQLLDLNKELTTVKFKKTEAEKIKNKIRSIQRQQVRVQEIFADISSKSAEYLANIYKHKYFVYALTHTVDGQRYWRGSFEKFLQEPDTFVSFILNHSFYPKNIGEKEIRYLARNEPWRSSWITAVKVGGLVSTPISHATDLQKALFTWSNIYDNAYESYEPPPDEVINNDDMFDAWMVEKSEERKREKQKKQLDKKAPVPTSMKNADKTDTYIIVETPEDAKEVFELNDPVQKNRIAKDEKAIYSGTTKEQDLPQSKELMVLKANNKR